MRWIDAAVERVALVTALIGGAALLFAMAVTVVSITGRQMGEIGLGPIPGDFELVEASVAFAVFAFLPWAHVKRGHVTVDLFLSTAGPRVNAAVDVVANLLMSAAALVIAWRLWAGLQDRAAYGDTTVILQFETAYAYGLALWGAGVFALVALWSVTRSLRELRAGAPLPSALPEDGSERDA